MTQADITRIFSEQAQAEANERAETKRLARARLSLKRRLDEIELGGQENE